MKKLYALAAILLLLIISSCEKSSEPIIQKSLVDLLPKSNEISSSIISDSGWYARNEEELEPYIDGNIALYKRYTNSIKAVYRTYTTKIDSANCVIRLYIYDLASETAARGVFHDNDAGLNDGTVWQGGPGSEAKYVVHTGLSQNLGFYKSQYYIYMDIDCDVQTGLNTLKEFALCINRKI